MLVELNKEEWIEGGGRVIDKWRRTAGSKTRFSASKRKNNFPHIMLLIAVRSLNYRMSIVYCELISPSFDSVHLSFLTHSFLFSLACHKNTYKKTYGG